MTNLRSFVWGIMVGITMLVGCLTLASSMGGIKWQPVKVDASR